MFRKIIISLMVFTALATAVVGCLSSSRSVIAPIRLTSHHWIVGALFDGRARLFWIASRDERLLSVRRAGHATVEIVATEYNRSPDSLSPGTINTKPRFINLGGRRDVASFGGSWRRTVFASGQSTPAVWSTFIRAPLWVLVSALLAYPAMAYWRGPVRQRRRAQCGRCTTCGYSLSHLSQPRCPECGTSFTGVFPDSVGQISSQFVGTAHQRIAEVMPGAENP